MWKALLYGALASFLVFSTSQSFAEINVTDRAKLSLGSSVFNKPAGTTSNDYRLKNISASPLSGPIKVVIESIDNRDVSLTNPDGYTPEGKPYLQYGEAALGPGEKSAPKTWVFDHRCKKRLTVTLLKSNTPWQLTFEASCSQLVTVCFSIFSSEGEANRTPLAHAGEDQTVKPGETVYLDGSQSSDPDGDLLTYAWSVISKPEGTKVVLSDPNSVRPSFKAKVSGSYVFGLTVSDGELMSTRDTCTIKTSNSRPVAHAGEDQTVKVGDTVYLDGSKSTDFDGNLLKQSWSIISRPEGSTATLTNPNSVRPSFTVDQPGTYVLQLIVRHGTKPSYPDFVLISTENSLPRANAGEDQTVSGGNLVQLDGSRSTDVDGDLLTYRWAILSAPPGSGATLSDPTSVMPSFTADQQGIYVIQLIVHDGLTDSLADTVVISTDNSRPIAEAGYDQTVNVGDTVSLDGSLSTDPDGNTLTYRWAIISRPKGSLAYVSDPSSVAPSFIADKSGTYVLQLIVSDGPTKSLPDTVVISTENSRPVADAGSDWNLDVGDTVYLDGSGSSDADVDPLSFFWSILYRPQGSNATLSDPTLSDPTFTPDVQGLYVLQLIVNDGWMASYPATVTIIAIIKLTTVPNVIGFTQATAESAITSANLIVGAIATDYSDTVPSGNVIDQSPAGGTLAPRGSAVSLVLSLGPETITPPPDPATVAPPIDPTVATTMGEATEFLYTGPNPIQTGVAAGTIDARRAAVLRGKVTDREGTALPGVKITILNHPEYGRTISRLDGMFDMAVNGGGFLTINYEKFGYLSAQRLVNVPWQDYVWAPDVVLIPLDSQATTIDLSASVPFQVAQGSVSSDSRGTRQSTLLFAQGTQAELVMPNGSTRPISTLTVRSTEYTVGEKGPNAMPGDLPLGIGYTYAVELSVDEARTNGASEIRFSQRVVNYLENFLGFDVGVSVPAYHYDRKQGWWIPLPNGRIIKILGSTGGLADLDVDGDDVADAGTKLTELGITDAERQLLVGLYSTGQTLWRAGLTHFSPIDYNYPRYLPDPYQNPPEIKPERDEDETCNSEGGSVIECQNQKLRESIALTGTPFALNYQSGRVSGRLTSDTLVIPLTGPTLDYANYLLGVELKIRVAGRQFSYSYPPAPNLSQTFTWDGQDAYGREVQGAQPLRISKGYKYVGRRCVGPGRCDFLPGTEDTYWRDWWGTVGHWNHGKTLGGWTLSVHHSYDPVAQILYLGTGEQRSAINQALVVDTVAGNGRFCYDYAQPCGDGGWATDAQLFPWGVDVGPDGSLYITDEDAGRIWRVWPNGIITHVAGLRSEHYWCDNALDPCGDGGPAIEARFGDIYNSSVGPDGSIYIADEEINRIRKVSPDGIITTVAGTGERGFGGDGGPATQAKLNEPYSVKVAPDGNLYIADTYNNRIRRVGPDGIITTIAGNGGYCSPGTNPCGDGGPATEAPIDPVLDLAIGPDGSIYFGFGYNSRIRKVSPDGIITTFAGTGDGMYGGDGGPARDAQMKVLGLTFGPDGSLFFSNGENAIRRIDPAGIITTVAGNPGPFGYGGDNGPATLAKFWRPWFLAVGPNGYIYVADAGNHRLRRVRPLLPGYTDSEIVISSSDGKELYLFDRVGRHLRTLDTITGATLYEFTYDTQGKLIQVRDSNNNITTVERDTAGNPTAIVGPYGQRTTLSLDPNGYLASITNPASETTSFQYASNGLMTRMTNPRGFSSNFTYDSSGRLTRDENAAGGYQTLARANITNGYEVTRTTAMGRTTTYRVENLPTGDRKMTNTAACCGSTESLNRTDGSIQTTSPDGTVTTVQQGPDPRFGMQSPIMNSFSMRTPGGVNLAMTMSRSVTLDNPYDPLSLTSQTDTTNMNGRTYTSYFDGAARTRTSTSPAGRQIVHTIDAVGRIVKREVSGINPVFFTYDSHGRLSAQTTGVGDDERAFIFTYNAAGYLSTITDPLLQVMTFSYDSAGRLIENRLADGRVISFTYDGSGNVTSVTPPGRPSHSFSFDALELLRQYTPPPVGAGTNVTTYEYDLDRKLTTITRPDGQTVSLTYTPGGKVQTKTTPDGTYSYTYDPATGQLSSISAPGGQSLSYGYDGNIVLSEVWTGPITGRVDRTANNDRLWATMSVNGADPITFGYDNDNMLVQAGSMAIARSPQNRLITGTTIGSVSDTTSYNAFGEPASYTASFNATPLVSFQYERDKLGRITQKTETLGGVTDHYSYTYDSAGRLTAVLKNSVLIESYGYDSNSNRITATTQSGTVTGTYDDQDRLLQYGTAQYSYTANGELLSRTIGSQTTMYQYDVLGNLVGVTLPDGTQITYVIDGQSRRVGKKVNNVLTYGLLYKDGINPIAQLDGSGAVVSLFVYGTKRTLPDYMVKGGVAYRIISDHLGSVRLVVEAATGAIAQRMDYDAFGNVTLDTNPGFQPFGFAGGLYDGDTGLTRFGVRDYDAQTGRWTSKDPIRFQGQDSNLYGYVRNDPQNNIDWTGLVTDCLVRFMTEDNNEPETYYRTEEDCRAMCKQKRKNDRHQKNYCGKMDWDNYIFDEVDNQCLDWCMRTPWTTVPHDRSAATWLTCLWVTISEVLGSDNKFDVRTDNAADVRG